jgi:hypothetical protein
MANELSALIGEILDGRYKLGTRVRHSAGGAILETEFGPDALPAVIKIRESQAEDSEALTQPWRNTLEFQHPNVLRVYATGSSMLNGVPIAYLVVERADESLENVLAERALTVEETRRMLVPAVAALKYLHQEGYQHSRLAPSKVLAVGDQLKLSCDSAIRLNSGESAAEDIRALGVLIVQALTQKIPDCDGTWDPSILKEIPSPLTEIARHCLDPDSGRRWTAEEVEAQLHALEAPPVAAEPKAKAETVPERIAPTEAPTEEHENNRFPRVRPKWIYAGVAALVLLAALVGVTRKKDSAPLAAATSRVVSQQAPDTAAEDPRTPKSTPPIAKSTPPISEYVPERDTSSAAARPAPPARAVPDPLRAGGRKADGWWVIVAAYNSREAAEKRMRAIAKRWPNFHVALSEPQSEKTRYVITLGQGLSEDQAEALRKRAVASGLPRDTYIKRVT